MGRMVLKALCESERRKRARIDEGDTVMKALMRSRMMNAKSGRHQAADKLHQAGADEIAQAFHVAHDARDERAGLVGIVKGDRQAADMRLHLAAKFGDHALRGLGEKLRQREGSKTLDHRRASNGAPTREAGAECVSCLQRRQPEIWWRRAKPGRRRG